MMPVIELDNYEYQPWYDKDHIEWACDYGLSSKQAEDGRHLACLGQPNKVFRINKRSAFSTSTAHRKRFSASYDRFARMLIQLFAMLLPTSHH